MNGVRSLSVFVSYFLTGYKTVQNILYVCHFSILRPDFEINYYKGYGVDSVQALILSFEKIGVLLDHYNRTIYDGHLRWLDDGEPYDYFGFLYPRGIVRD